MSNRAITWAYAQRTGSVGRKAVLVALADKADEDNTCFPKQDTLAEMTDQSARAVRGHLAELERMGLIERRKHYEGGRRKADRYRLPVAVAVGLHRGATVPAGSAGSEPAKAAGSKPARSAGSKPARSAGKTPTVPADSVDSYRQDLPRINPQENPQQSATRSSARGTRLAADWVRTDADKAWQAEQEIPDEFARQATAEFKDHFTAAAGARGVKLDWSATWRNWIRRAWRERHGEAYRRSHGQPVRVVDFEAERVKARTARARRSFASTDALAGAR